MQVKNTIIALLLAPIPLVLILGVVWLLYLIPPVAYIYILLSIVAVTILIPSFYFFRAVLNERT